MPSASVPAVPASPALLLVPSLTAAAVLHRSVGRVAVPEPQDFAWRRKTWFFEPSHFRGNDNPGPARPPKCSRSYRRRRSRYRHERRHCRGAPVDAVQIAVGLDVVVGKCAGTLKGNRRWNAGWDRGHLLFSQACAGNGIVLTAGGLRLPSPPAFLGSDPSGVRSPLPPSRHNSGKATRACSIVAEPLLGL